MLELLISLACDTNVDIIFLEKACMRYLLFHAFLARETGVFIRLFLKEFYCAHSQFSDPLLFWIVHKYRLHQSGTEGNSNVPKHLLIKCENGFQES